MAWIYWPVALMDANLGWRLSTGSALARAPVHTVETHVHATAFAVVGHDQYLTQLMHSHPAGVLDEFHISTTRRRPRFHLAHVRPVGTLFRRGVG